MRTILSYPRRFLFLISTLIVFFLLRFPSLFEPHWYGDESIYQAVGFALARGRILYRDIWDNKPPLLYLLYALGNGDLYWIKTLSLLFGLASVVMFFFLAAKILKEKTAVALSTAFFAFFFAIPMFEGNIANAENFLLLPILTTAYLLYPKAQTTLRTSHAFYAGIIIGISFLLKVVAVFDLSAFLLFLILTHHLTHQQSLKSAVKRLIPVIIGFLLPILMTSAYFFWVGALPDFVSSAFLSNFDYVNEHNAFIIPQGILLVKITFLFLFLFFIIRKRILFKTPQLFIAIWFGFSLFSALFSQRPYTHYLLVLLPAFSLAVGHILQLKNKLKVALILVLSTITFLLLQFYWYYSPLETVLYYQNFLLFLAGKKDVRSYQTQFDNRTSRDYDVTTYLKLHLTKEDTLFIWGDAAEIYPLTKKVPVGRYTVAYHMLTNDKTLNESMSALVKAKPRYIVIFPDVSYIPFTMSTYRERAEIDGVLIYERNF